MESVPKEHISKANIIEGGNIEKTLDFVLEKDKEIEGHLVLLIGSFSLMPKARHHLGYNDDIDDVVLQEGYDLIKN